MAVGRVKQNVGAESWVGAIATVGDPIGRSRSWLGGADFTYATSTFRGDKNLRAGAWILATGRDDITGTDRTAAGFKIDYPNDSWEVGITGKRTRPSRRPTTSSLRQGDRDQHVEPHRSGHGGTGGRTRHRPDA
ncbi:MAG: hypothetical protein ABI665_10905 [Vicinamibacterales bacterium]